MTKRIMAMLLVAVMILSFAACSGGETTDNKKPDTTVAPVETTGNGIEYEQDDLPANLNFDGESVTMLVIKEKEGTGIHDGEILSEELNSDVINDSVYNRERYVEDRLGIEIVPAMVEYSDYNKEFDKMISSDEDMYQICASKTVWFASYAFDNVLTDLYTVDHLDLEKPWWSQYFNEKAELKDSLYLTTGSLSLSLTRFLFVTFYNKQLAEDYSEKYPELGDLYTVVNDGDWTYDKFYSPQT